MKIGLLTDAPHHNLALMKLSTWHKAQGDEIYLKQPLMPVDKTYASILFSWNLFQYSADEYGGIQYPEVCLPRHIEWQMPDYELFNLDYSLGYTYRPCFRKCDFCLVKTLKHPDKRHHSIHKFHNPAFKKICILNNNWLLDPLWKETFEEVWESDLTVIEHGFDLRLINKEKADAIKKTKFEGKIHFAWDRMRDEQEIREGLEYIKDYNFNARFYVLAGYDTTIEQDIYRCQVLADYGHEMFIMLYKTGELLDKLKTYINTFVYWHYRKEMWKGFEEYLKGNYHPDCKRQNKSVGSESEALW